MREDLDEREACRGSEGRLDVTDAEEDGDEHGEAEGAVDADAGEEGVGHDGRRVLDLFAHVHGAVSAQEGEDGREQADEEGGTGPIAAEGEVGGEDVFGVAVRGEVGQSDEDAEEADDVQDEHGAFHPGELCCQVSVEEEGEESDGEQQEGALIWLGVVVGVVKHE